jgi:hypothetical protein
MPDTHSGRPGTPASLTSANITLSTRRLKRCAAINRHRSKAALRLVREDTVLQTAQEVVNHKRDRLAQLDTEMWSID